MAKQDDQSDTCLIDLLKQGDEQAANDLIKRYFSRVVKLAERHLNGRRMHTTDGDDIAASVFESLWENANSNRLKGKELADSQQLWRLLSRMVAFKTCDHIRRERAQKRGGEVLLGESGLTSTTDGRSPEINNVGDDQFDPATQSILQEEYQRLMDALENETLREIAVMRMSGYQVTEIAETFGGKSTRWVGRKLHLIRETWRTLLEFEIKK